MNNTGYEVGHHENIKLSDTVVVTMFVEESCMHKSKETGRYELKPEEPLAYISAAIWTKAKEIANSKILGTKEFEEQADFYRFLAELQSEITKEEKIKEYKQSLKILK